MEFFESELGIGNRLQLTRFWKTCRTYNLKNGLHPSESLYSGDYTVAMETGTGKTYVYLRTIFELYQRYGFATFIIVVPSVAIKEGTYKALQTTR
jgi:type III restriction enzyme